MGFCPFLFWVRTFLGGWDMGLGERVRGAWQVLAGGEDVAVEAAGDARKTLALPSVLTPYRGWVG